VVPIDWNAPFQNLNLGSNTPPNLTGMVNTGGGNFDWSSPNYASSEAAMAAYFNGGGASTDQTLVDQANRALNLQSGNSFAWRAIPGAPGGGVYEVPGGGYFAQSPDGKWGYNAGGSGGGTQGGPAAPGTPGGPFQLGSPNNVTSNTNPTTAGITSLEQYLINDAMAPQSANPAFSTDPNSPIVSADVQAYGAQQTQGMRNTLAQLAESGGADTNLNAETRSLGEAAGQATSGYQAQLMTQQLAARQNEIQQALTEGGNLLTTEQQNQLQEEYNQNQLALSNYQFNAGNSAAGQLPGASA
jgi:hypothetical protein